MKNDVKFLDYLVNEKKLNQRSAKDVISRCKRVEKIVGSEEIDNSTMDQLLLEEDFSNCSMFVKSQLKRCVSLYQEYVKER